MTVLGGSPWLSALSDSLAFVVGGLTAYFDCFGTLAARVGRVPETFASNPFVIGLALACGGIAALACRISGQHADSVFGTVLTLRATDPYRGFVVGASVLVLLRSKLFNIQDSPFGGDYLYVLARDAAIQKVDGRWTALRAKFQYDNVGVALADPHFEMQVSSLIEQNITSRPDPSQKRAKAALDTVIGKRPASPFEAGGAWKTYYQALIGVALDACGPSVVRTLPGFR